MAPEPEDERPGALVSTRFAPYTVSVEEPTPGLTGNVVLHQYVGKLNDAVYTSCTSAEFTPDIAVAVGEALADAGRKARSGLHLPH